ncbi:NAD(P)H-dependent oxidoreductase [Vibrio intestinalis]|uniref:NAD(P)H-dependent oxidoreductase n=1 Tax=Vibrio intestinalis TaxID=2933291 RepID=UPI0021A32DBF|nr:NAD(P)H-dependent oxidoreductase [Vibrio intestinalis]
MSKTLVISGHPNLAESYTNTVIIDSLQAELDDVSVRCLDVLYPDYNIDVEAEQAALIEADVIVLQFPFYWYSVPALMKKWIDDVMSFNFAYGPEGDKLKGKDFFLSFTIGGPAESYDPLGYNHFTVEQLVFPLQQTAYLAGVNYHKPVYSHRMVYIPNIYNELEDVQARARVHAAQLVSEIEKVTLSDESRLRKFVANWFAQFDLLPEQDDFFVQSLAEDVVMTMPEGNFVGLAGFKDWYQLARQTFKPDCVHDIEQFELKATETGYQIELRIRLKAETYPDSSMKGETIELPVNETWHVSLDEEGKVCIHDYKVVPVVS